MNYSHCILLTVIALHALTLGLSAGEAPPDPKIVIAGFHKRLETHPKKAIEAACIGIGKDSPRNPLGDRTELLTPNPGIPFYCDKGDLKTETLTLKNRATKITITDIFDIRGPVTMELLGRDGVVLKTLTKVKETYEVGDKRPPVFAIRASSETFPPSGSKNAGGFIIAETEVQPIEVVSLTYSGASLQNVFQDSNAQPYVPAHWEDTDLDGRADTVGEHHMPVGYVRSTKPTVAAQFRLTDPADPNPPASYTIRGTGSNGMAFAEKTAPLNAAKRYDYPTTESDAPFPATVKFYNPLTITWEFKATDGSWKPAGSTDNRIYVLLAAPVAGTQFFESVAELSCRNADGEAAEAGVIAKVWSEFTDRDVKRKPKDGFNNSDNAVLYYYKNWQTRNIDTSTLLSAGDAQCNSWAKIFMDMLKIHGVTRGNWYVTFQAPQIRIFNSTGFLVNSWDYIGNPAPNGTIFPNSPPVYHVLDLGFGPGPLQNYTWKPSPIFGTDINDLPGAPGQSTLNPASWFNNHKVVEIDGTLYDPSYGKTYNNQMDFETKSVSSYQYQRIQGQNNNFFFFKNPGNIVSLVKLPQGY